MVQAQSPELLATATHAHRPHGVVGGQLRVGGLTAELIPAVAAAEHMVARSERVAHGRMQGPCTSAPTPTRMQARPPRAGRQVGGICPAPAPPPAASTAGGTMPVAPPTPPLPPPGPAAHFFFLRQCFFLPPVARRL